MLYIIICVITYNLLLLCYYLRILCFIPAIQEANNYSVVIVLLFTYFVLYFCNTRSKQFSLHGGPIRAVVIFLCKYKKRNPQLLTWRTYYWMSYDLHLI